MHRRHHQSTEVDGMMPETLPTMLARKAAARGDCAALVFADRQTTFAQLAANSDALANALLAAGARPGARIGYLAKNSDRFFELLFAAGKAGLVLVPIGWRLTRPEIAFLLDDSSIDILFVSPEFYPVAKSLSADRSLRVVSLEQAVGDAEALEPWRAHGGSSMTALPVVEPESPVLQLYTSGTTGKPKGAVLSHANLFALRPLSAAAGIEWDKWDEGDVSLVPMPISHVSGAVWGLIGLYSGIKSIIMPEFDAGEIIRIVSAEPISKIFMVPAAMQAVLRHPAIAQADFSRLRYILYGASPIPLDLLSEAVEVFGCGFVQNYGMTETTGTVTALGPEDHTVVGTQRMRSAGRAMPGVDLRIVDETLVSLPPGQVGEILVRSPTNMLGYWNRTEATKEALVDGWMRTGDAGYLDDDGYLYVQDRLKDMIITGGENVYPAEVENVLYGHPDIADVAVIGIPDIRWGEAVTAIVVPTAGSAPDEGVILAWARERLAAYKVPKRMVFQATLPRNPSGKVLRRELRAPFWEGRERAVN